MVSGLPGQGNELCMSWPFVYLSGIPGTGMQNVTDTTGTVCVKYYQHLQQDPKISHFSHLMFALARQQQLMLSMTQLVIYCIEQIN